MAFLKKDNPTSRTGCLLIHGYGGTPHEMEGLDVALNSAGIYARTLCLPGHGNGWENFSSYRYHHWLAYAQEAFTEMQETYERIVLVGFSMGGTIALNLAGRFPVAGVTTISAPVHILNIFPWPLAMVRFHTMTAKRLVCLRLSCFSAPGEGKCPRSAAPWHGGASPLNWAQLLSVRAGCKASRHLLPQITAPLLVMHDERDQIVYAGNAWEIARGASSQETTLVLTRMGEDTTRSHKITTHHETADIVANQVVAFARRCLAHTLRDRKR